MSLWNDNQDDAAGKRHVLSVRQVNDAISDAIGQAFPRTIWVRGEVQRFPHDAAQRKHLYFELQETGGSGAAEYQIAMALMGWDRQRYGLDRYVDGTDPDFQITNKLEVCLECKVDFYAKFGKISLKIVGVDKTFALGKLEARRRETLAYLTERGLLKKNSELQMPDLPLRIGLITSAESAAHHDFMTGIAASGWAFEVSLCGARMQGEMLQDEVIAALVMHQANLVDVIVITRGGGSRADLSWFDQRDLAVAIAESPVPVITAIGHEIDTSIADLVAHHSCKTPTAAAENLVEIIDNAARRLDDVAAGLLAIITSRLDEAGRRLLVVEQLPGKAIRILLRSRLGVQDLAGRLMHRVGGNLAGRRENLSHLAARLHTGAHRVILQNDGLLLGVGPRLSRATLRRLSTAERELVQQETRLVREAPKPALAAHLQVAQLAEKTRLLDPVRLLARGYSLTVDSEGKTVTNAAWLAAGDSILTQFAKGQVRSIVQPGSAAGIGPGAGPGSGTRKRKSTKGKNRGSKQKETGQKSLFR